MALPELGEGRTYEKGYGGTMRDALLRQDRLSKALRGKHVPIAIKELAERGIATQIDPNTEYPISKDLDQI